MSEIPERVPFLRPELPELEVLLDDFSRIHRSGRFSNGGPFEERLSAELSDYLGVRCCSPVANATLGLMLAAQTVVRRTAGKKVLLPSFTFPPSALAAEWIGLEPVFCDIDARSWQATVDADSLYRQREEFALIVLCNTFGAPADVDRWKRIAERCAIPLLIDSAAGLGATYPDGRRFGQAGCVEVFSMHATKAFAIGEGGAVVTDDVRVHEGIRALQNFGFDEQHIHGGLGINAKMSEFHAAIACRVLERYEGILAARRAIAAEYRNQLDPYGFSFQQHGERSTYPFVPVCLPSDLSRSSLRAHLERDGIETRHYFSPPLHRQPRYRACETFGELQVTDAVAEQIVSLPISNTMTRATVARVCASILEHVAAHKCAAVAATERRA